MTEPTAKPKKPRTSKKKVAEEASAAPTRIIPFNDLPARFNRRDDLRNMVRNGRWLSFSAEEAPRVSPSREGKRIARQRARIAERGAAGQETPPFERTERLRAVSQGRLSQTENILGYAPRTR